MSLFSDLVSVEGLFRFFQVVAIAAGTLAVLGLIGKDITSGILSRRNATEMLRLQRELAEARTKQAEAELALAEIKRRQEPRRLDHDAFVKGVTAGGFNPSIAPAVHILYQPNDPEAYAFALSIQRVLMSMNWSTHEPREILPDAVRGNPTTAGLPVTVGLGGGAGITIFAPTESAQANDAGQALERGFTAARFAVTKGQPQIELPFSILIGPRP